jgi:esterase/lipase superfamily enzyme
MSARALLSAALLYGAAVHIVACAGRTDNTIAVDIDVPFLTTRGLKRGADGDIDYSTEVAELSAGHCQVALHQGKTLEAQNSGVNARSLTEVMDGFTGRAEQGILVYVHGYNIGLERACRDAARLAHVTGFVGRILLFSWPASRAFVTYRKDEQRLAASAPAVIDAIIDIADRYGYGNINIVAHSMGTRVVLTLKDRALKRNLAEDARFDDIVLVAPDIDREQFLLEAPDIQRRTRSLSVLVSEDDKLLLLSQFVNQDPRLGQASDLRLDDIEIVDVSDIEDLGLSGHIYHLENNRIGELLRRILTSVPPD